MLKEKRKNRFPVKRALLAVFLGMSLISASGIIAAPVGEPWYVGMIGGYLSGFFVAFIMLVRR